MGSCYFRTLTRKKNKTALTCHRNRWNKEADESNGSAVGNNKTTTTRRHKRQTAELQKHLLSRNKQNTTSAGPAATLETIGNRLCTFSVAPNGPPAPNHLVKKPTQQADRMNSRPHPGSGVKEAEEKKEKTDQSSWRAKILRCKKRKAKKQTSMQIFLPDFCCQTVQKRRVDVCDFVGLKLYPCGRETSRILCDYLFSAAGGKMQSFPSCLPRWLVVA